MPNFPPDSCANEEEAARAFALVRRDGGLHVLHRRHDVTKNHLSFKGQLGQSLSPCRGIYTAATAHSAAAAAAAAATTATAAYINALEKKTCVKDN